MRQIPRGSASPTPARAGGMDWGRGESKSPTAKRSRKLLDKKPLSPAETIRSGTSPGRVRSLAKSFKVCLPQLSMKMRGQTASGARPALRFSRAIPMGALSGQGRLKNMRGPAPPSADQPSQKSGRIPGAGWAASRASRNCPPSRPCRPSKVSMARNGAAEARNSASVTAETPRAARTSRAAGWSARNRLTGRRRLIRAAGETEEAEGEDASGGQRAGPLAIP